MVGLWNFSAKITFIFLSLQGAVLCCSIHYLPRVMLAVGVVFIIGMGISKLWKKPWHDLHQWLPPVITGCDTRTAPQTHMDYVSICTRCSFGINMPILDKMWQRGFIHSPSFCWCPLKFLHEISHRQPIQLDLITLYTGNLYILEWENERKFCLMQRFLKRYQEDTLREISEQQRL